MTARLAPLLLITLILCGTPAVDAQTVSSIPDTVPDTTLRSEWDRAVLLARDQEFERALEILRGLLAEEPSNLQLRGDLAAVLAWSGQDAEAVRVVDPLPLREIDPVVLESVGGAALSLGETARAIGLYRAALEKEPGRPESEVGLSLAKLAAGDVQGAVRRLPRLRVPPLDGMSDARLVSGHILAADGRWGLAAVEYRRARELRPGWSDALEGELRALREAGAYVLANRTSRMEPGVRPLELRHDLEAGEVARIVEWTPAPAPSPGAAARRERIHHALDRATETRDMIANAVGDDMGHYPLRRVEFDRFVALRNAEAWEEIDAEGERLRASGVELPPYILRVLADAALEGDRPREAIPLYRETLRLWPGQLETTLGLFWSLVADWRFQEADELLEHAIFDEPDQRWGELREPQANPDRLQLELARHLGWALGGDPARAQSGLEHLHFMAPLHLDVRQELAAIYGWRGWHRRAEGMHQRTGALDPEHVPSRIGRMTLALELDDRAGARALADTLVLLAPDAETVARGLRQLHVDGLWEFSARAGGARSTGGAFGTRDRSVESTLTSPPLSDRVRLTFRTIRRDADYPEGRGVHDRLGLGLEVRARPIRFHLETNANRSGLDAGGISASGRLPIGDHWTLSGRAESYAEDVPLRARLQDIRARGLQGSVERRSHEARRGAAELTYLDFSDGNVRTSAYLAFEQQLVRRPRHRWAGLVEGYGSRSRLPDPPYFSPTRLWSATGTLLWDWTLHRLRETSYAQRLALTGGVVGQADERLQPTVTFTVEHRWEVSDQFDLLAGVHGGLPVYDGVRERRTSAHLGLTWKLP